MGSNRLRLPSKPRGPLCYPLLIDDPKIRGRLIDQKIFVPTYWPNIKTWCEHDEVEYRLADAILPLPIDQRYGAADMQRIVDVIRGDS